MLRYSPHAALASRGIRVADDLEISTAWLDAHGDEVDAVHLHWPERFWRQQFSGAGRMKRGVLAIDSLLQLHRFLRAARKRGIRTMAAAGVGRDVGRVLSSHTSGCRIEQLFGDSTTMNFEPFYGTIDLFFVDGCHDYEAALGDTRTAWRCLHSGGLLVWHDYPWTEVQAAIRAADLGVPVTFIRDTNLAFASKR